MTKSINPIRTALASFGMSGRVFHGPFLKAFPEYEVVRILERTKSESAAMFPSAEIVREYHSLLSDEEIELIIINTPNYLHYSMTKQALEAGKHVVVEKPFTTTVAEAKELIALAEAKNLVLTVYHNRRWDSDFLTIQELIKSGRLGKVEYFEAHFDRYRPDIGPKKWKETPMDGAGILYDLGSHLIDQAITLFGKPNDVFADVQIQRTDGTVPDYFRLELSYPDLEVILTAGMLVKESSPKYTVIGDKGTFFKHGQDTQEQALVDGATPDDPNLGKEPSEQWGKLNDTKVPALKGDYGQFYKKLYLAIRENKKAPVLATEALYVVELIEEAIKRSPEHLAN